jgi:hypothetical protein
MMIGGDWERRKKRYLNLLLEKGDNNKKENKVVAMEDCKEGNITR